jgi:hypothetical protein
MQALRAIALGVALVGAVTALPGCATAQAPAPIYAGDPAGLPEEWEGQLASYGTWRTVPQYGTVWWPRVGPGWRPYLYGNWASSPAGWTWFSAEPWGFTFNYGRWAYAPIGWVWVPGTVWGPAWVDWYWGPGYVGWAPIGFYGAFPWSYWVFVNDYDFGCRNVNWYAHGHGHHNYHGGHHGAPPRDRLDRVARQPIVRVSASEVPNRDFTSRPVRRDGRPGFDERNVGRQPPRGRDQVTTRPVRPGGGTTTPGGNTGRPPSGGGFTQTPSRPSSPGESFQSRPVQPRPGYPSGQGQQREFGSAPVQPHVVQPGRDGGQYRPVPRVSPQNSAPSQRSYAPEQRPSGQGNGYQGSPSYQRAPSYQGSPSNQGSSPSSQGGTSAPSGGFSSQGGRGFSSQGFTGGGRGSGSGGGFRSQGTR